MPIVGETDAQRAVVYGLTQRGFFSEVNVLVCLYAYALATGEAFFVDDEGFVTPWGNLFASPVPLKAELDPAAYAAVIECNPKGSREAWIERLLWVMRACRQGRQVEIAALGFAGAWPELLIHLSRIVYRPLPEIAERAALAARDLGLHSEPFCAVHVRRGDKTEGKIREGARWSEGEAIGFGTYVEAMRSLAPGVRRVFMLTDDYAEVVSARAEYPHLDIVTLCSPSDDGYRQREFRARPRGARVEAVRQLMVEVQIALRSQAFVGVYRSNVSLMIAALHPRSDFCVSVDSQKIWSPVAKGVVAGGGIEPPT